jgi:hypothetical protein
MGGTGNLRTMRISATGGTRTIFSLVADGVSGGGGSTRRVYAYYASKGDTVNTFYYNVFGIQYGQFKNSPQFK